jgi:hypothetical protein
MNCLFCHNEVYPTTQSNIGNITGWCHRCNNLVKYGDWAPKELHTANHGDDYGWCHHCPLPILYKWRFQLPNDRQFERDLIIRHRKDVITSMGIASNNPDEPCFMIYKDFKKNITEVNHYQPFSEIVKLDFLLDINPNNFQQKLKTLIVFS